MYAAKGLSAGASAQDTDTILDRTQRMLNASWQSPAAIHMIADTLAAANSARSRSAADVAWNRARELEVAVELASAVGALPPGEIGPWWRVQGTPPFFAGVSDCCVVVARGLKVLETIHLPERAQWVIERGDRGEPLGDTLPGLRLAFAADTGASELIYVSGPDKGDLVAEEGFELSTFGL